MDQEVYLPRLARLNNSTPCTSVMPTYRLRLLRAAGSLNQYDTLHKNGVGTTASPMCDQNLHCDGLQTVQYIDGKLRQVQLVICLVGRYPIARVCGDIPVSLPFSCKQVLPQLFVVAMLLVCNPRGPQPTSHVISSMRHNAGHSQVLWSCTRMLGAVFLFTGDARTNKPQTRCRPPHTKHGSSYFDEISFLIPFRPVGTQSILSKQQTTLTYGTPAWLQGS